MTPDDRKAFVEVVMGFAELKGKQISAPAIELYWRALQHWALSDFRAAAEHLLRTCQWMPVPKDFEDLRRNAEPTAAEAWDAVFHHNGVATARATRAAHIAANGRRLGHLDLEREVPHVQRRFMDIYRELSDVEESRAALPHIENTTIRLRSEGPMHVGTLLPRRPS